MSENNQQALIPGWFWAVSGVALVWNLLGVMAFAAHLSMTPEILANLPSEQRQLYESAPAWLNYAFGIAVIGGALGCVGLLMKKYWAFYLFVASLVGVLAQNLHSFFLSNTFEVMGKQAMIMPIVVILIAIGLVFFARMMQSKNILS